MPAMLELKTRYAEMSPARADRLKQQVALNAHCPRAVALYVDLGGDDWLHIYPAPKQGEALSTDAAINTFLDIYNPSANDDKEINLLERLIFNPTPDYATVLEEQERETGSDQSQSHDSQDDMIASFLSAHPAADVAGKNRPSVAEPSTEPSEVTLAEPAKEPESEPVAVREPVAEPVPEQKSESASAGQKGRRPARTAAAAPAQHPGTLSESLARIFIRQKRYRQAYDIISDLNLNYPEKSVYFADQLRFLRRLIAIQEARAQHAAPTD